MILSIKAPDLGVFLVYDLVYDSVSIRFTSIQSKKYTRFKQPSFFIIYF